MSSLLSDRLVSTFLNVKHRLETLLNLCRISEKPSWTTDDDGEELYRFIGPYRTDIEELEKSIIQVSLIIENLQHEQNTSDDCKPFPDYPLCENDWTLRKIEEQEQESLELNLNILNQLRLFTINKYDNQFDSFDEQVNENSSISIPILSSSNKNLLDLPPELLLHIFSSFSSYDLLTNLAPTCRYFANLILTRIYSHLNLYNHKRMSIFQIAQLLSYLPNIHSMAFIDWHDEISILTWAIWFEKITKTTSQIQTISFQNILISPILICLIVEYFSHSLQTIIFHYQHQKAYEKFDLILSLLADENMQLKHITASYQTGITNFGILQLVNNLNKIKELNLLYVEAISDQTVKILCDKHQSYLEILRIDGIQLTDQALDSISQCKKLKSLMIEFCENMTGRNFHIFHNLKYLKELSLSKLGNIPIECYEIFFDGNFIFEYLIVLKLGECHSIDDNCLRLLIKMCPRLIDFTCSWASYLTDDGFNEIVRHCHCLQRLSLVGCYQITGRILTDVPQRYLQYIKYLDFEHCNQIDDDILIALHQRNQSIQILNYYGTLVNEDL